MPYENELTEWRKKAEEKKEQQLKEGKIKNWRKRFLKADDDDREWHKVYSSYLNSDIWKAIRKQAISQANSRCEICQKFLTSNNADVHHITYDRVGGRELPCDLKVVCSFCHPEADQKREVETEQRRKRRKYESRVEGFARKKYGEYWNDKMLWDVVEEEFVTYRYKKESEDNYFRYSKYNQPQKSMDFYDFWNDLKNGDC